VTQPAESGPPPTISQGQPEKALLPRLVEVLSQLPGARLYRQGRLGCQFVTPCANCY
jgi:hypothetical protein